VTQPWKTIDSVPSEEGLLELLSRGERDFLLKVDGRILMNSTLHLTEKALAKSTCAKLKGTVDPKVLIGGLGMGYTLRAALDHLPAKCEVLVAELNPVVVRWCRGPLANLTNWAVSDGRVQVKVADVAQVIAHAAQKGAHHRFDAIILDLYEGPRESNRQKGDPFYGDGALKKTKAALHPKGIFAVWSEDPDRSFETRLTRHGFSFQRLRPGRGGPRHTVYLAEK
jgi:spermidine synthase